MIKYHIDGVLENGSGSPARTSTQFYWNLIPRGWQQTIDAVDADRAPAGRRPRRRQVRDRQRLRDRLHRRGRRHDRPHRRPPARSPTGRRVTIATGLDMETPPEGNSLPWTGRWDRVLGTQPAAAHLRAARSRLARLPSARSWAPSRGRSRRGFPVLYEPPDGHRPGAGRSTSTARRVDRTTYVATLMHAAEKGAIDLDRGRTTPGRSPTRPGRRAGPGSTRSPPTSPTSSAARARRSPRRRRTSSAGLAAQGARSSGSTAASRPGPRRRETWSAAASAASAACWCWSASA